jgi:hypothetical protein
MDFRLHRLPALGAEALLRLGPRDRLPVPVEQAGGVDRELDLFGPQVVDLRARLRQLELDGLRQERRGDTSITSISGTMLISAIGVPAFFGSKLAKAAAAGRAAIDRTFGPASAPTPVPSA